MPRQVLLLRQGPCLTKSSYPRNLALVRQAAAFLSGSECGHSNALFSPELITDQAANGPSLFVLCDRLLSPLDREKSPHPRRQDDGR